VSGQAAMYLIKGSRKEPKLRDNDSNQKHAQHVKQRAYNSATTAMELAIGIQAAEIESRVKFIDPDI